MSETAVYRMYDDADCLLYVGVSINVPRRLADHRRTQQWWPRVTTVRVKHFEGRRAAAAEERDAIANEGPEFNIDPGRCVSHDIWPRHLKETA